MADQLDGLGHKLTIGCLVARSSYPAIAIAQVAAFERGLVKIAPAATPGGVLPLPSARISFVSPDSIVRLDALAVLHDLMIDRGADRVEQAPKPIEPTIECPDV